MDVSAPLTAALDALVTDVASTEEGSLGQLGVTGAYAMGQVAVDCPLPYVTAYASQGPARRKAVLRVLNTSDVQVDVYARTPLAMARITNRCLVLLTGLVVSVWDDNGAFDIGLQPMDQWLVDHDAMPDTTGKRVYRQTILLRQDELRNLTVR